MKKIIATVLAMVMALALCTTAFAATYGDVYEFANGKWNKVDMTGKTITYTSASETTKDAKFVEGTVGYYTIGGVNFVEVDKDVATYRVSVDGVVKYLLKGDNTNMKYTLKGEEVTYGGMVEKCGDVYAQNGMWDATNKEYLPLFKDADGVYYKETSVTTDGKYMLVGGQVVLVAKAVKGTDYSVVSHGWEALSINVSADGVVTGSAKCTRCGQTATITSKLGDIPTDAKSDVFGYSSGIKTYIYWTEGNTTTSTGSSSTTATSPKTFDAGIAMYVGMALTSVAGSAVVIGKKKEF